MLKDERERMTMQKCVIRREWDEDGAGGWMCVPHRRQWWWWGSHTRPMEGWEAERTTAEREVLPAAGRTLTLFLDGFFPPELDNVGLS